MTVIATPRPLWISRISLTCKAARVAAAGLTLALGMGANAWAQLAPEDPDWKESEVPPPPAFDMGKLVTFDGAVNSSLVYGVDPASIRISGSDNLIRYVLVAVSANGAKNVMYEAIRCSTGEFKTYARHSSDGRWSPVSDASWRSMFGSMPSRHAFYFARAGACDNSATPSSVSALVLRLKNPNLNYTQ
jgi:hypothetical protein